MCPRGQADWVYVYGYQGLSLSQRGICRNTLMLSELRDGIDDVCRPKTTTTTQSADNQADSTHRTCKTLKVRRLRGLKGRAWVQESVSVRRSQRYAIHIIPPPNISRNQKKDQHSSYVVENNTLTPQPDVRKLKSGGGESVFWLDFRIGYSMPKSSLWM